MKQTPTIGRIVTTFGQRSNGSDEHPAILNRVWSEGPDESFCVNLTIFPDCDTPKSLTSVYLFPSKEAALVYREKNVYRHEGQPDFFPFVAYWPERV